MKTVIYSMLVMSIVWSILSVVFFLFDFNLAGVLGLLVAGIFTFDAARLAREG